MKLNWLRVFRVREVFPGISSILIAALDTSKLLDFTRLLLMTGGFLAIFFSAFLINELVDSYDVDRLNPEREKAITKHGVSRRFTFAAFAVTSVLGIGMLSVINLFWAGMLTYGLLFFYSAPPLRLKGWPFLELVVVTLGCALMPYISYYWLVAQPFTGRELFVIIFLAAGFPAIQLVNEGADFWADYKAKIRTTAVLLGEQWNLQLIQALALAGAVLGLAATGLTGHWWYLYIVAVIFFLFTAARFGLTIVNDRDRLHELLRTGEKFGVFASDIGTVIMLLIYLGFAYLPKFLF